MLDPRELYELDETVLDSWPAGEAPVLVVSLDGFVDAGNAGRLAVMHLFAEFDARPVATFDVDQLVDYRGRRPTMVFDTDRWVSYAEPALAVYELRDSEGTRFLVLTGKEPDLQWERFAAAVTDLTQRLGVRLTVGLNAIPMPVPHTRPTTVTTHGTRPELVRDDERWFRGAEVPASAAALLEFRLGQAGYDAMGIAAHVPHYLAAGEYPSASTALLRRLARATGLSLPVAALEEAAERGRAEIDQQVAASEQATGVVRALERQYDAVVDGRQQAALLAPDEELDPGEFVAEVERFLAEQSPGDGPDPA
ncbi:MAG TPA: PAC2 family protein [Pseudonocardiaceae bacterium]